MRWYVEGLGDMIACADEEERVLWARVIDGARGRGWGLAAPWLGLMTAELAIKAAQLGASYC